VLRRYKTDENDVRGVMRMQPWPGALIDATIEEMKQE
jgi:hypothetical protein